MLKQVGRIIKGQRGTAFPLVVAVSLALIMLLCVIAESMRLMIIASGVRNAVQSAVISTVTENYDDVYHAVREGYSGGYRPSGSSWSKSEDLGDIYGEVDRCLGLKKENGRHVKYAGGTQEFSLSELSVEIQNTSLAPSSPEHERSFLADAEILLEVPVSFCGKSLPPMRVRLKAQAKYMPLF
ncbi:hypothetical protein A7X67_12300 [Clostridium sp. W14A]|nr:hypothetical protein A7X67_12300 [Clostridium sp. W14A]